MLLTLADYPSMLSNAGFSTESYKATDVSEQLMVLHKPLNVHNNQHKVTEAPIPLHENSSWPSQRAVPS